MARDREIGRRRRHGRARKKIVGTPDRPRVNIYRSLNNIFVQAIDDSEGKTLVGLSTATLSLKSGGNIKAAETLGTRFGELLNEKGIKKIVFDRGGYLYHGRVKALADSIRKKGISF